MRAFLVVLLLLACAGGVAAQSGFFVKASGGTALPYARFELLASQQAANLLEPGLSGSLTVGRDLGRHFGLALTGTVWGNGVRNERMTEYLRASYLPAVYQPYLVSLQTTSPPFRFYTAYLSPFVTFQLGPLRFDLRGNAGLMRVSFPGILGSGISRNPLAGNAEFPLTLTTDAANAHCFVYGGGGTLSLRVFRTLHLIGEADGLRGVPQFGSVRAHGTLSGPDAATTVSLEQVREAFSQPAGTLSIRAGLGFYF